MSTVASPGLSAGTTITPLATSFQAAYSRKVPSLDQETVKGYHSWPFVLGGAMTVSVPSVTLTRAISCFSPLHERLDPSTHRW